MRSCCSYAEPDFHLKLFFGGFFMSGTNKARSLWFLSSGGAGTYRCFCSHFVTADWQRLLVYTAPKSYWKSVRKVTCSVQKDYWTTFAISSIPYIKKKKIELCIKDTVWAIYKGYQIRFSLHDHKSYLLQFFSFSPVEKNLQNNRLLKKTNPNYLLTSTGWVRMNIEEKKRI